MRCWDNSAKLGALARYKRYQIRCTNQNHVFLDEDNKFVGRLLYEYYWEFNYPMTPTTFALRTDRFKLIQYHGIWDTEELYDLENDPREMHNLIDEPEYLAVRVKLRKELHRRLANSRGDHVIPYTEKWGPGAHSRNRYGSTASPFPANWLKEDGDEGLRDFMIRDERRLRELGKQGRLEQ